MFERGQGVLQDYKEAVKWYRLAADQGNASAQYNLGAMYENGQGVPQDYREAMKWYRLAANQGYPSAQNNLGAMYADGRGVPQDYKEAVKWYRLAAYEPVTPARLNILNDAFHAIREQDIREDICEVIRKLPAQSSPAAKNAPKPT